MKTCKNILIISADYTGHGHKSITQALCEQFDQMGMEVTVADGFLLSGKMLQRMSKAYGPITRRAEFVWRAMYRSSHKKPQRTEVLARRFIEKGFLRKLEQVRPDVIVSVHSIFNKSITDILKKHKMNIPLVTVVADLVTIPALWANPDAALTLCPTPESKDFCLARGLDESRLAVTGFPVRSRFYKQHQTGDGKKNCLVMSGGEGSGKLEKTVQILLENFDFNLFVIAGRNQALKRKLERQTGEQYPGRVNVLGFVTDIEKYMHQSHLAITRGSPNVLMECVASRLPVVIVQALPGQEEGNPGCMEQNGLGVYCPELERLEGVVRQLMENDGQRLEQIKQNQKAYADAAIVPRISEMIVKTAVGN